MTEIKVLSVTEFMNYIKGVLEDTPFFRNVSIVGELSNFTPHRSGHFYFSLKDEEAVVKAVMFRSQTQRVIFKPKNGDKVVIKGRLGVYPATGEIQLYVNDMTLDGLGDLYIRFEALRKELFEKGWFNEEHKKPIPKFPKRVGVISGEKSAAHADITRTLKERWPLATQIDYYAYVQGALAIDDLALKIQMANDDQVDVIILARGGGSIEDLWAFNELKVVQAVYLSDVPIISGVGHESDITLVDYVSDYRAATPTAAAVMATPLKEEVLQSLRDYKNKMYVSVTGKIKTEQTHLSYFYKTRAIANPISILDPYYYKLDLLNSTLLGKTKLFESVRYDLYMRNERMEQRLYSLYKMKNLQIQNDEEKRFTKLRSIIDLSKRDYASNTEALFKGIQGLVSLKKQDFSAILKSMKHLSPFSIMERGYSIASHDKKVIKSVKDINKGDFITVQFKDGNIEALVKERNDHNDSGI